MHPIDREIGTVFVSVSDIEAARRWYCLVLGIEPLPEILFGHLCVLPMRDGSGLALDAKGFVGGAGDKPAFHLNTSDVDAARSWLQSIGAEVGDVTDSVYFNFRDPDGNLLMIANVPKPPRP